MMKKIFFTAVILILPLLVFAQDASKKKAYYFYGDQCPHCQKVDEYFKANGIYDKYDITKLDFSNPFNTRLLLKFGEVFKSEFKGSVPAIAFADKFLVGDQPIIDNFEKEIDAADASALPDPDKMNNAGGDQAVQENKPIGKTDGNKKNLFPVVITALIIIVGGALIFINRKKSNK